LPGEKTGVGDFGAHQVKVYTIRFDDLTPLRALPDRGVEVPPLLLANKHAVKVLGDGKQVASFYFRFSEFRTNEVCLVHDNFYEMWSLLDCENARAWHTCGPPHKLPWVEVASCEVIGTRVVPANGQYYTEYQIRYAAEGREFSKYESSGLPPSAQRPSEASLKTLPKDCRYRIRYHPGMPDKAEVSLR
jgi:hypothetical protein